jgi:hypothetical protein
MQEESSPANDTVLIINEKRNAQSQQPSTLLVTFDGLADLNPAHILVDSGATNNYISESFVRKHRLYTEPIKEPTKAILANGISLNVTRSTPDVQLYIQDYVDELHFNVIPLDKYDVVLGIAWLNEYSAAVDYSTRSVTFQYEEQTLTLQPVDPTTDTTPMDSDSGEVHDDKKPSPEAAAVACDMDVAALDTGHAHGGLDVDGTQMTQQSEDSNTLPARPLRPNMDMVQAEDTIPAVMSTTMPVPKQQTCTFRRQPLPILTPVPIKAYGTNPYHINFNTQDININIHMHMPHYAVNAVTYPLYHPVTLIYMLFHISLYIYEVMCQHIHVNYR